MLEDLALRYSELPDAQLRSAGYGLVILGGIIGGITNRSMAEIKRAPYFAMSGIIFLGVAVVSFAGITIIVQALVGGFFWTVVALEMLASVAGGFFLARVACARSRDAYGHGRNAALAFIPIANFWLLFTPSRSVVSANTVPTIPLFTGGLGVLSGFVLLTTGVVLSAYAQVEGVRRVEAAAAAGMFNETMLDRTLAAMAAEGQTPTRIDEITTLVDIESAGAVLRYVYEVDPSSGFSTEDIRHRVLQYNCFTEGMSGLIDAGAAIQYVYSRSDGSELGIVEVTKETCGR